MKRIIRGLKGRDGENDGSGRAFHRLRNRWRPRRWILALCGILFAALWLLSSTVPSESEKEVGWNIMPPSSSKRYVGEVQHHSANDRAESEPTTSSKKQTFRPSPVLHDKGKGGDIERKDKEVYNEEQAEQSAITDNEPNSDAEPPSNQVLEEPSPPTSDTTLDKTTTDSEGKNLPFPVYESLKDEVPSEPVHAVASEQLECRQNVIEFVINATDVKDECEGLRKAFDASCSTIERRRRLSYEYSKDSSWFNFFSSTHTLKQRLESAWDAAIPTTTHRRLDTFHKPLPSLSLPTTNKRVDEQIIHDTVLLQPKRQTFKKTLPKKTKKKRTKKRGSAKKELKAFILEEQQSCCASILTVFHDHCDTSDEDDWNDRRLFGIVLVIGICGLVKSLIRHFKIRWLPEAGGCILVGALMGSIMDFVPHGFDEKLFLRVMLPPIVFEAALIINKRAFQRHIIPIFIYAFAGTILCSFLAALFVRQGSLFLSPHCTAIPFVESLIYGSLISSIDPIAVLSILVSMGIKSTDTLYVIIFGESLLNDGVAVVLFDTLVHFLDENVEMGLSTVKEATGHFFLVAIGSVAIGLLCGVCCTLYFWAMNDVHSPMVEVLSFFCWALTPYYICDGMHWSGIVAIVTAGFFMDLYVVGEKSHTNAVDGTEVTESDENHTQSPREVQRIHRRMNAIFSNAGHMSAIAKNHVGFVTSINATLMETAIFAYLGLFLFSSRYHWNFYHSIIALFSCIGSRAAMIISLTYISNWFSKRKSKRRFSLEDDRGEAGSGPVIDRRMQIVLWFSGLRGAMSFALVENIPLFDAVSGRGSRLKPELKAMTSVSIMFTTFVLGGSTFYIMERLGMSPRNEEADAEDESLPFFGKDRKDRRNSDVELSSTPKEGTSVGKRR